MVTDAHLRDDVLIDLLEGTASEQAREHAAACPTCRSRLEQSRSGLDAAREADVPEPSPLFWQGFRREVDSRIRSDAAPWRRLAVSPWLAAAAVLVVALALLLPGRSEPPAAGTVAAVLPAWSPLPPADEDPGLEVLAAVLPSADLEPLAGCQGLGDCMADAAALSEDERAALAEALRREMGAQS
jgi:hypothetical protein